MIGTFLLSWLFSVNGPLQIIRIRHCLFEARFLQEFGIGSAQHNLVPSCRSTCVCLMFNKGKFTPNTIYCDRSVPRSAETGNFPTALPSNLCLLLQKFLGSTAPCNIDYSPVFMNKHTNVGQREKRYHTKGVFTPNGGGGSESGHR